MIKWLKAFLDSIGRTPELLQCKDIMLKAGIIAVCETDYSIGLASGKPEGHLVKVDGEFNLNDIRDSEEVEKTNILDWLKLHHEDGVDFFYAPKWSDFKVVESKKAYEKYESSLISGSKSVFWTGGPLTYENEVVCVEHEDLRQARRRFYHALMARKLVASSNKLEGYTTEQGQLILQNRMPVTERRVDRNIERCFEGKHVEGEDLVYKIMWYGKIGKVPPNMRKVDE